MTEEIAIKRSSTSGLLTPRISGLLVQPNQGRPPRGAIVLCHPASGSSRTFLRELSALSVMGYLAIAVDAPFTRLANPKTPRGLNHPGTEKALLLEAVADVGHALAFLREHSKDEFLPGAVFGRNYGATVAGLVARQASKLGAGAFVLQAGIVELSRFYLESPHPVAVSAREGLSEEATTRYLTALAPLDLMQSAEALSKVSSLIQFGGRDEWIPREGVEQTLSAHPRLRVEWLAEENHDFQSPAALERCLGFLTLHC